MIGVNQIDMKSVLIFIFLLPIAGQSQKFCETTAEYTNEQKRILRDTLNEKMILDRSYNVRVFFHLVRHSDGKGGQPLSVIPQIMANLEYIFKAHRIFFKELGHDEIRSSDFMDYTSDEFVTLTKTKAVGDAINIYLLDDNTYNDGKATIPGLAFVIGGMKDGKPLVTSLGLTHEMGHCLGLLHTYDVETLENEDSSNCCCAGDWVCDTVLDSDTFTINSNCKWNETEKVALGRIWLAKSDPTNNMTSIDKPECYKHLTPGQGRLMRKTLGRNRILKPVWR
jgi:hypothetical protein